MSLRALGGFIRPGYNPLRVPNAPTIGTATAGNKSASVAFTAPACVGGSAITGYVVRANCGKGGSGSSSPITVSGLCNGVSYTFTVAAINSYGPGTYSASSNSVTPTAAGQQAYTTAGTYSWVAPACVTSVSIVAVGGGGAFSMYNACYYESCLSFRTGPGGGGGGGLGYKNNYAVTPGNSYTVVVGAAGVAPSGVCKTPTPGGDSYFVSTAVVKGGGGGASSSYNTGGAGGTYTGDGGGNGGAGQNGQNNAYQGGPGGAGGYSGNGGAGVSINSNGNAGSGGGGGSPGFTYGSNMGGSGGVGILGQGSNGTAGSSSSDAASPGGGGSGGASGGTGVNLGNPCGSKGGSGGLYGGVMGTSSYGGYVNTTAGFKSSASGGGAVRIIWPGNTRKFPSTCTGDK